MRRPAQHPQRELQHPRQRDSTLVLYQELLQHCDLFFLRRTPSSILHRPECPQVSLLDRLQVWEGVRLLEVEVGQVAGGLLPLK